MTVLFPGAASPKFRAVFLFSYMKPIHIPRQLFLDRDISAGAKILFGHIINHTVKGKCILTNRLFTNLMNVSTRTIRRWIGSLEIGGYIDVELSENSRVITPNI